MYEVSDNLIELDLTTSCCLLYVLAMVQRWMRAYSTA